MNDDDEKMYLFLSIISLSCNLFIIYPLALYILAYRVHQPLNFFILLLLTSLYSLLPDNISSATQLLPFHQNMNLWNSIIKRIFYLNLLHLTIISIDSNHINHNRMFVEKLKLWSRDGGGGGSKIACWCWRDDDDDGIVILERVQWKEQVNRGGFAMGAPGIFPVVFRKFIVFGLSESRSYWQFIIKNKY